MIKFYVNKEQHERIRNNAQIKGFSSISSYLRHLALEEDFSFERKFIEMYNKIMGKQNGR